MTEPIAFEIPIYKFDEKKHSDNLEKLRNNYYSYFAGPRNNSSFEDYKLFVEEIFHYYWKYNEVIGYLNIYFLGRQYRIEYWFVNSKRIRSGINKKKFKYIGKLIEKDISKLTTNSEIYNCVLESLVKLKNYPKFIKRHIDLTQFLMIGKHIDWLSISKSLNRFENPNFHEEILKTK